MKHASDHEINPLQQKREVIQILSTPHTLPSAHTHTYAHPSHDPYDESHTSSTSVPRQTLTMLCVCTRAFVFHPSVSSLLRSLKHHPDLLWSNVLLLRLGVHIPQTQLACVCHPPRPSTLNPPFKTMGPDNVGPGSFDIIHEAPISTQHFHLLALAILGNYSQERIIFNNHLGACMFFLLCAHPGFTQLDKGTAMETSECSMDSV